MKTHPVSRRQITAIVALLVALAIVFAVATRNRSPKGSAEPISADGMKGMAGMGMSSDGTVTVNASQIREFGITFGIADVRALSAEARATGVVTFDETRMAQVSPKFGGFIERLYVNSTGQPVRRGQPLLEIYSPELVAAEQELLLARQLQQEMGRSSVPGVSGGTVDLVAAAARRLSLWDISERQVSEILQTGHTRRTLTLYAPVSGVVIDKMVLQGQATVPGQALYTIADLSNVWIDVQLREFDVASVQAGSVADIEVSGLPGMPFKGRVAYVYPTLDSASRAVRARIVVSNTSNLLKPGMYVTVRLATPGRTALTVPNTALLRTGERNIVFVDMGRGQLMPMEVETGRTTDSLTEILEGLEPGQRVVTSAQFLLDSESNLGEVMKAMIAQMGSGKNETMQDMPGMTDKGANTRGMPSMPGMKKPESPRHPERR